MKREIDIFFTALMFYTRIPCPSWIDHREEYLNRATKYFPLVGWIVASISLLILYASQWMLSAVPSLILALAAAVLTTGAFHEDGLADVCDGFGGGWTKEKILDIMKDSRVGTFGVVGLLLTFLFKIALLNDLLFTFNFDFIFAFAILLCSHAISRFIASTFIATHSYVRENDNSKAKPVAKSVHKSDFFVAGIFAFIAPVFFTFYYHNGFLLWSIPVAYIAKIFLGRYFKKWIGGYTGDCLGATQQITEIVYLITASILWKYT